MIDKKPTPGDYTDWVMEPYQDSGIYSAPMLHDTPPARKSSVLGPDGNPMMVDVPRRRIGFDLTRKEGK